MSAKQRWPEDEALEVATEIIGAMNPSCERIVFAGSLRRRRPTVGDIEILYIPWIKLVPDEDDLMRTPIRTNLADQCIARLEKFGALSRRRNSKGSEVFGDQNKLMLHVGSGIPVDLFATTLDCWWNYLVCRTGPAESNVRIASEAKKKGWKWHPYGSGFTTIHGAPASFKVLCEEDVFRLVGLPYLPPEERK